MSTTQKPGTLVSTITSVELYHLESQHVVVASGVHNSSARNARLVPQPSIQDHLNYTFEVDEGPLPVLTPVRASASFEGYPRTVTVRAANDSITVEVHALEDGESPQPTPFDAAYSLVRFEVSESFQEVIPGTTLTAYFQIEGQLVLGSGGCNTYSARWVYMPGLPPSLRIYELKATKIRCTEPEGIMEQEARYFQELELVETWEFTRDGLLRLSWDEGRMALVFKPLR